MVKRAIIAYVNSKGPVEPAHSCSCKNQCCLLTSVGQGETSGKGLGVASLKGQGPVVQSAVSLISSLVVKMLTVLVSTISNSQVFLLKKCE